MVSWINPVLPSLQNDIVPYSVDYLEYKRIYFVFWGRATFMYKIINREIIPLLLNSSNSCYDQRNKVLIINLEYNPLYVYIMYVE